VCQCVCALWGGPVRGRYDFHTSCGRRSRVEIVPLAKMFALLAIQPASWAIQPASATNVQQAASLCIDEFETYSTDLVLPTQEQYPACIAFAD
jgi:hypothetical protein